MKEGFMRSVSKLLRGVAPALLLAAVLSQSAYAAGVEGPDGPRGMLQRLKHFVVHILDELHVPPG
jgi:hypothetical protein